MNRIICFSIFAVVMVFPSGSFGVQEITLLQDKINLETRLPEQIPVTAQVSVDQEQSQDGNGSMKIVYIGENPLFIPLREVRLDGASNCELNYEAWMKSEGGRQEFYLEMWCIVAGKSYFSKALDQNFAEEDMWFRASTPFYLQNDQPAEKAVLGIRFEGPGVAWIDQMRFTRRPLSRFGSGMRNWQWIPGTLFGCLAGLFGAFVGIVAQKGRSRRVVMGMLFGFIVLSAAMLIAGVLLWLLDAPYSAWYAILLPGFLGVLIFPPQLFAIPKIYEQAEIRRLEAKDITEL